MIRLWNRVGVFRSLSVIVLALGLAGGLLLADRGVGGDLTTSTATVAQGSDDVRQHDQDLADQKNAQDKADQLATSDAERAKAAEDQTRKNEAASRSQTRSPSPSGKPGVNLGPIPTSCAAYSGNKALGCAAVVKAGLALDQMVCLDKLWTKESHWNTTAANPSGAYGIPQANPGSKMATFGSDWKTNPATQIAWGMNYIKGRYSTPCGAWSHSQSSGWY